MREPTITSWHVLEVDLQHETPPAYIRIIKFPQTPARLVLAFTTEGKVTAYWNREGDSLDAAPAAGIVQLEIPDAAALEAA